MKLVILSTYDQKGGAAIAAFRLCKALNKEQNVEAHLLVKEKQSQEDWVIEAQTGFFSKLRNKFNEAYERFCFMHLERDKSVRFQFSIANTGISVSEHPLVKEADLIHLHWINQAFLSLNEIDKLQNLNKPVVWTLHDMWAFTGGEHYTNQEGFLAEAGNSEMLKRPGPSDISHKLWKKKKAIYKKLDFVTCSKWLKSIAKKSSLLKTFSVEAIPNPIDIDFFKRRADSRFSALRKSERIKLLFGAFNIQDPRKGFSFLAAALNRLPAHLQNKIELIIVGKSDSLSAFELAVEVKTLGSIKAEIMPELYSVCDVMVVPSLQDNLPNTVMEAMACECPVIAFRTGGIPEMIDDGVNGILVDSESVDGLAAAIENILQGDKLKQFAEAARSKVLATYAEHIVANSYLEHYQKLLAK